MTFGPSIYIQVLIPPLVAELLKYSVPQTLFFFSGTSQANMSPLMSSLTLEGNSLRSGMEHYILSLKQKSKQTVLSSLALALMKERENKCSKYAKKGR